MSRSGYDADDHLEVEVKNLRPREELRLEIGDSKFFITLTQGTAEVYGADLQLEQRTCLQNTKIAIFSWSGCTVKLEGTTIETPYVAEDTPMADYLNAAHIINNQRAKARDSGSKGPSVAIVGPPDSGKSTLATLLVNYAIRQGWTPLLVDTDVGAGMITVPGCLSASLVEVPIDPEEGVYTDAPVAFFYGHITPHTNPELYEAQVTRLAQLWEKQNAACSNAVRAAGTVINTLGWVEGMGKALQVHVCKAFQANVICVIGDDKLHSSLSMIFRNEPSVEVVKLPKSGGVVALSREARKALRDRRIQDYYYGVGRELQPATQTLLLSDVSFFRVAGNTNSHAALLPAGVSSVMDPLRIVAVEPSDDLVGSVLGVSYAEKASQLVNLNVAGFVWVMQVDMSDKSMSVLCPHGSSPPGHITEKTNYVGMLPPLGVQTIVMAQGMNCEKRKRKTE